MVATRSTSRAPDTPLSDTKTSPPTPAPATGTFEMTTTDLTKGSEKIISTPAGDVRVRPFRSSSNAQLKAVLSFTPRHSSLDRFNAKSQGDQFRGFFVLFWIGMALLFARTSLESWETNRTLLGWSFGRLITRDGLVLALADFQLLAMMYFCVPFVKGLQNRWYSYHWVGMVIQHTYQTFYLGVAIWWGYHRQWYWVQSGFLVLHALSSLMKMHSYMAHNGMLATVFFRLQEEKAQLARLVESLPGGNATLLAEAAERQKELEAAQSTNNTPASSAPSTPNIPPSTPAGLTAYSDPIAAVNKQLIYLDQAHSTAVHQHSPLADAVEIRRRSASNATKIHKKKSLPSDALPKPERNLPVGTSLEPSATTTPHDVRPPSPLAWSSNERVALLARNIDMMEDELKSNGAKGVVWPQNVSLWQFTFDYMCLPTLVYQLEYPRTNTIRPLVVLEKIAATFGTFSLIYLITEHFIMPYTPKPEEPLYRTFVNLALPMIINYLLIFYIIFECVCTGFAELSYFADREFYQDWWNSTSWDQFSRRWNKPVHTFLLRHVYASTMHSLQISRTTATLFTFFLSALVHEFVMAIVTKKIRPYLFLMQLAQLPMIAVGKLPIVKRNKTVGNIVLWAGLISGFPLLAICYLVY